MFQIHSLYLKNNNNNKIKIKIDRRENIFINDLENQTFPDIENILSFFKY